MTHTMKLAAPAFQKIRSQTKQLELRLYDDKRRTIALDDEITFINLASPSDTATVKVKGLLRYPTFQSLLRDLPTGLMGYPESQRDYLETSMYEVYSPEDEAKYGVLGIRFTLLG